jgi:hypothetical protein
LLQGIRPILAVRVRSVDQQRPHELAPGLAGDPQGIGLSEVKLQPPAVLVVRFGADAPRQEPRKISVSAVTGQGLPELIEAIRSTALGGRVAGRLKLSPAQSRVRAKLFDWRAVRGETPDPAGGWTIDVELTARRWRELASLEGLSQDDLAQIV